MGRRRRSAPRKRRQGPGHNEANRRTSESRQKTRMLDSGVEHKFRYYSEELLNEAGIEPETWRPFLQTLWTRGSRQGLDEARVYLDQAVDEGIIPPELRRDLRQIIDRYSIVR